MDWLILGVGAAGVLVGYIIGHRERRRKPSINARSYWFDEGLYEKTTDPMPSKERKNER